MKIREYDIQWGSDPIHLLCGTKTKMKLMMGEIDRVNGQFFFACPCGHILEQRREMFISEPFKKELAAERLKYNSDMEKRRKATSIKPDTSNEKGNYWSGYQEE